MKTFLEKSSNETDQSQSHAGQPTAIVNVGNSKDRNQQCFQQTTLLNKHNQ